MNAIHHRASGIYADPPRSTTRRLMVRNHASSSHPAVPVRALMNAPDLGYARSGLGLIGRAVERISLTQLGWKQLVCL